MYINVQKYIEYALPDALAFLAGYKEGSRNFGKSSFAQLATFRALLKIGLLLATSAKSV